MSTSMAGSSVLVALRDALIELYPDRADARRIVADARVPTQCIAWSDKPINNWHTILEEACKHGKVESIIAVALSEYKNYLPLLRAAESWRDTNFSPAMSIGLNGYFDDKNAGREIFHSIEEVKGKVDFAIITIKSEELKAVLDQFHCSRHQIITGSRGYALTWVSNNVASHDGRSSALVAITRCPAQGNGVAQDVARDIIEELDPQWLLVVGIAGAIPASEFSLGDVVLASSLLDFSVEAVKAGKSPEFAVEGRQVHSDVENYVTMVDAHASALGPWFNLTVTAEEGSERVALPLPPVDLLPENFYGNSEWQRKVKESLEAHTARRVRPMITVGAIGSSDRLIKDDEIMEIWLTIARHVRAVEMESAGVYLAARGRGKRKHYPAMSIRGISDIVGFKRHEGWTRYACESAAAFAYAFVRSGYLPVRAQR